MRRITRSGVRRAVRARLARPIALVGSAPRVTVVVWAPPSSAHLDECVSSIRSSAGVLAQHVPVADPPALAAAVARTGPELVAFVHADHTVTRDGLARLAAAMTDGVDLVAGLREVRRGGRVLDAPPPGSLVDLSLTGKLFRRSLLADARPPYVAWERQPVTTAALAGAAREVATVDDVVVVERDRDTELPIDRQRRFRADLAAERLDALREVLNGEPRASRHRWREEAITHLLPGLCRDAVGGGTDYHAALQPFALDLVAGGVRHGGVAVTARIAAWVAAHGSWTDLALTEDHLAAQPNGLPVVDGLAVAPEGLSVHLPDDYRRIGAADRRLRSRVLPLVRLPDGRAVLRGNAFVTTEPDGDLPTVTVARLAGALPLDHRTDPTADEWAGRAWEDRRGSGFEATVRLPAGDGDSWRVQVALAGHVHEHVVSFVPPGPGIDEVALSAAGLRVSGEGAPVRLRLVGPHGTTPWADAEIGSGGRFAAVLPLRVALFDRQSPAPAGHYALEVQGSRGRSEQLTWAPALLADPPDLTDARHGLRLTFEGLTVEAPLTSEQRSAFGQQQRITAYAGTPRAELTQTVLLESFHGRAVTDNPAAIGRALAEQRPELDLVWVVDDPSVVVPDGTRAVARRTPEWYAALAGAHAYVSNAAAPPFFAKKAGQLHLQTWHGTPLKRIGEDRGPGRPHHLAPPRGCRRHRRPAGTPWSRPARYCSEIFRSAFGYDGPMLEIGYPRNDVLLSAGRREVRADDAAPARLDDGQRVVLYAPTWRDTSASATASRCSSIRSGWCPPCPTPWCWSAATTTRPGRPTCSQATTGSST